MVLVYPSLISRRRLFSQTTSRRTTLICTCMTRMTKVSASLIIVQDTMLISTQEYKDDSQIIPRSSSVIAKRMPAGRPGKGKAAMYIGSASTAGPSDHRPDNSSKPQVASWNSRGFGAMSKRFDGKDEKPRPQHSSTPTAPSAEASAPVSPHANAYPAFIPLTYISPQMPSLSTQTDEEKERIKAMFQAETENWEETQERMSQFVLIPYNYPSPFKSIHSHKHDLFAFTPSRGVSNVRSATPIYNQRHTTGPRKPYVPHQQAQQHYEPKPLPPGYVCHRCSKKGAV
jgi:protein MPE1